MAKWKMNVDLDEPKEKIYSLEEKNDIRYRFLVTLHTLLLIYLSLHNFLIPFVMNLSKGLMLLTDIHYWFLFHIPMNILLRKKKTIWSGYYYFLIIGTCIRIVMETSMISHFKSWGIFSVYLSEISSIIFYFLIYPVVNNKLHLWLALTSFLLVPFIILVEKRSPTAGSNIKFPTEEKARDYSKLGCEGSENSITFPIDKSLIHPNDLAITDCGFNFKEVLYHDSLKVINHLHEKVSLRLYHLYFTSSSIRWKFVKLIILDKDQKMALKDHITANESMYLLKSPDKKKLGHAVIIFENSKITKGRIDMNYDSIQYE